MGEKEMREIYWAILAGVLVVLVVGLCTYSVISETINYKPLSERSCEELTHMVDEQAFAPAVTAITNMMLVKNCTIK